MVNRIEIEGIDKMGKDTLVKYIDYMSGRIVVVKPRGLLSNLAFANIFGRDISNERIDQLINGNKDTLVVYLTAEKEDWQLRMIIDGHEPLEYEVHKEVFEYWKNELISSGIKVLEFNTSKMTPYQIAKIVIDTMEKENK